MKLEEKTSISFAMKQVLLWGLLFAGLIAASIAAIWQNMTWVMTAQNLLVFIAPALLFAWMIYRKPLHFLCLDKGPEWKDVAIVVAVMILSLPAMNYLVDLNSQMHLPSWLSGVEEWMRESEDAAQELTSSLLNTTSPAEMLLLVLIVGVLTGIGEEMFFRGALLGVFLQKPVYRICRYCVQRISLAVLRLFPTAAAWVVVRLLGAVDALAMDTYHCARAQQQHCGGGHLPCQLQNN